MQSLILRDALRWAAKRFDKRLAGSCSDGLGADDGGEASENGRLEDGERIWPREVCSARTNCGDGVAKYAGCLAS